MKGFIGQKCFLSFKTYDPGRTSLESNVQSPKETDENPDRRSIVLVRHSFSDGGWRRGKSVTGLVTPLLLGVTTAEPNI